MSVNFKKIKNRSSARALMKHCDKIERLKNEHSNKDINKKETNNNLQLYEDETIKQTMTRFTDRIKELDSTSNTNKRKDRVELFSLDIPIPHGIPEKEFFVFMCESFKKVYGEKNIVNMYLHTDEKHSYIDTKAKEEKMSLNHIHAFLVPEIEGKLQGKLFSSKNRMRDLNKAIDNYCKKTYSVPFLTGDKIRSKEKVEELKKISTELAKEIAKVQAATEEKIKIEKSINKLKKDEQDLSEKVALFQDYIKLNKTSIEILSENADLTSENQKLKQQNSLLIKILKSIEKLIENSKVKEIIRKAIDAVEEKQSKHIQYHTHSFEL